MSTWYAAWLECIFLKTIFLALILVLWQKDTICLVLSSSETIF